MSSPDRLDEAFARHLREQLPTDWPRPPVPAEPRRTDGLTRSRLALAAAAAVLLGLGMLVSRPIGPKPAVGPDPLLKAAEASGANLPKPEK